LQPVAEARNTLPEISWLAYMARANGRGRECRRAAVREYVYSTFFLRKEMPMSCAFGRRFRRCERGILLNSYAASKGSFPGRS
jgi:hypothetical protein